MSVPNPGGAGKPLIPVSFAEDIRPDDGATLRKFKLQVVRNLLGVQCRPDGWRRSQKDCWIMRRYSSALFGVVSGVALTVLVLHAGGGARAANDAISEQSGDKTYRQLQLFGDIFD